MLALIGWAIGVYSLTSLAEWYIHRYQMHRRGWFNRLDPRWFTNHQRIHHPAYRVDFERSNPLEHADVGVSIDWRVTALLVAPIAATLVWLGSPVGGAVVFVASVAHSVVWTAIHAEMHMPRGRWFSRTAVYRFYRRYHEIHHRFPRANLNVVCPGADWFLGTLHRDA